MSSCGRGQCGAASMHLTLLECNSDGGQNILDRLRMILWVSVIMHNLWPTHRYYSGVLSLKSLFHKQEQRGLTLYVIICFTCHVWHVNPSFHNRSHLCFNNTCCHFDSASDLIYCMYVYVYTAILCHRLIDRHTRTHTLTVLACTAVFNGQHNAPT